MDQRVDAAIAFMNANLHRKLTPVEIAQSVRLSPSHLRQLFKSETGTPLARYLKQMRLVRARELLETTFLSIKEIVSRVGLHSFNHFISDFKNAHGVTPSQFAARYRRTTPTGRHRQKH
jgi:transcriptional regulator GlxA family with amidase domain